MKKNFMNGNCFKGCKVILEVELRHSRQCPSYGSNNHITITYWGTYLGVIVLAKKPYVVLKSGVHYTPSDSHFKFDEERPSQVRGKLTLVSQERILSIDLEDNNFDIRKVDLSSYLM